MKTPSGLLGAALLFWGWQTGFPWTAAFAALVLEGARLISWRLVLSDADLKRIVLLCNLLLGGGLVYFLIAADRIQLIFAVISLLQFVPLAVFPLIASLTYTASEKIEVRFLSLSFGKKPASGTIGPHMTMNLSYPYFCLCLLSAATNNMKGPWFFGGVLVLIAWALWSQRSRSSSPILWAGLLLLVGGIGYAGHVGLHRLQGTIADTVTSYIMRSTQGDETDPLRSRTAIGRIGTLKLSDRILLRVKAEESVHAPFLLREASYTTYAEGTWFAGNASFSRMTPDQSGSIWTLQKPARDVLRVHISVPFEKGRGVLPLPQGAMQIERLAAAALFQNTLGTVTMEEGPGLVEYDVLFTTDAVQRDLPGEADLRVPKNVQALFGRIVDQLGLKEQAPDRAAQTVAAYFRDNFLYAVFQEGSEADKNRLEDFLIRSRKGHCEYFATSTVLLLRAAGIPARYATGYSVQEYSGIERAYVARSKHAHAWALIYRAGGWHELDTTPPSWFNEDQPRGAWLRPAADLWSWVAFRYAQWKWHGNSGAFSTYAVWVALLAAISYGAWLYFKKQLPLFEKKREQAAEARPQQGRDSELYALEQRLSELGLGRRTWEPLLVWIERIGKDPRSSVSPDAMREVVRLHYRYRFDPRGIASEEREELRNKVLTVSEAAIELAQGRGGAGKAKE